jgi:uncharacterized protein YdeI (YjbR/CyaY-like superfamily)
MSYEDSVEEALCFGWIDSIIKRIDEDSFARKFTPRTDTTNWSELNKKRVAKCIQEGRMTEIGLAKVSYSDPAIYKGRNPRAARLLPKSPSLPGFMANALQAHDKAWKSFNAMPPSHQRNYILWITMAKRTETREKRLKEAIQLLNENKRLGLK